MEELFILGSSYLAPNNKEWASNLKEYNSSFGNYGDWQSLILKRDAKQNVLLIMFVDDFMSVLDHLLIHWKIVYSPFLSY